MERYLLRRNESNAAVFFAAVAYDESIYSVDGIKKVSEIKNTPKLLLAGIAKPKPFFAYLQNEGDEIMEFSDHHHFSASDIDVIRRRAENRLVITTEKDFVRLKEHLPSSQLFYLPIKTTMVAHGNQLDQIIINYVGTSTRNR
jgi:tetraacyldisaccharide 4'-kinase